MSPLNIHSFPKAIIHIDGDCFFVSCEMALNPSLKGKPVITGSERGIASSMSYEAKALGVKRGMSIPEIKKICPQIIILPSDYETYSLFSVRMYNIVRRYTNIVEEYSIDECFADITGLRRPLNRSYPEIAQKIKDDLERELGMTFSIGLGPNKVIAKVASKWNKPSGLIVIPSRQIHEYLAQLPLEKIWGIGPNTSAFLYSQGLKNTLDLAVKDRNWVQARLSKPYFEIWRELRGEFVYSLNTVAKHEYQSISKTKTFTPPSDHDAYIFSQLSKNIENACIKARRHGLAAREIFFFLKTQDFRHHGLEVKLSQPVSTPATLVDVAKKYFPSVFRPNVLYRATGIVLLKLTDQPAGQLDLFGERLKLDVMEKIYESVDELSAKYGKHTVFLGSSLLAMREQQHYGDQGVKAKRKTDLFVGETARKHLSLPVFGEVV